MGSKDRDVLDQPWWAGRIVGGVLVIVSASAPLVWPLTLARPAPEPAPLPQAVCVAAPGQVACGGPVGWGRRTTVEPVAVAAR